MKDNVQNFVSDNEIMLKKESDGSTITIGTDFKYKHELVLVNAIFFIVLHLFGFYGLYLTFTVATAPIKTFIISVAFGYVFGEGVTIGAHRYYAHKSYKAVPFLRAILLILHAAAGQNSMYTWCRDHRLHHRYSDTDADPHNAKRGFFFSHIGWLMHKKHPYVIELGRKIDMSDLQADWMVMFQKKYFFPIHFLVSILLPVSFGVYYLDLSWTTSLFAMYFMRYVMSLHLTWLINSATHLYGTRPYDKNLLPVESWFIACISLGEGWHNYHHTFPWDYKAAELSERFNSTAKIIEFLAKIGLAYDLTASPDLVKNRVKRTGDGSHEEFGDPNARPAVRAIGPLHRMNPSYTVAYPLPEATLSISGLPLNHDEDIFDFSKATVIKQVGVAY